MPNVTIFIPSEKMPSDRNLVALTDQCTQLCTGILQAALENVHIIYVGVRHGRGNQAFAEIKYRLEPFRTKPVMDFFMENWMASSKEIPALLHASVALATRPRPFMHATDYY